MDDNGGEWFFGEDDDYQDVPQTEFPDIAEEFTGAGYTFDSREEAEAYVREVAGQRNITLKVDHSKEGVLGRSGYACIVCSRRGSCRGKKSDREGAKPRKTKTATSNCMFEVHLKETGVYSGIWEVFVIHGRHNHPFPRFGEGSRLGTITSSEMGVVKLQERNGIPPRGILASIKSLFPENVTTIKQVYNATQGLRGDKRENRNSTQNFLKELEESDWAYECRAQPGTDVMGDIVFASPESFAMLNTYWQVTLRKTSHI